MKHIFLVEDDLEIAKNLALLLRSEGFTITHAATQKEAILMLAAQKYDLALLDISLPDGNGFAVCTDIKQTQNIPVIFLTASGDEGSVVTGLNIGADDYVTKPFRPRELIARIGTALRKNGTILQLSLKWGTFMLIQRVALSKRMGKKFFFLRLSTDYY